MRRLADVNVVFALLVEGHAHHPLAWKWWEAAADQSVTWCFPVRMGVLRLLTNRAAMAGNPVSVQAALAAWDEFAQDVRACEVQLPWTQVDPFFRRNVIGREPGPNLWMDAWLAACAQSQGIGLVSFDRDFESFESLEFLHLRS